MPDGTDLDSRYAHKSGFNNVGALSSADLNPADFEISAELARFSDGFVLQGNKDNNGNGVLEPVVDAIVGGVKRTRP